MERDAVIRLKEGSDTVLMTDGKVIKRGDNWNILYEDGSGKFAVGLCEGIITLSRLGEESYTLIFEKDREHRFSISTPFGNVSLSMFPLSIVYTENDNGIDVGLEYEIRSSEDTKTSFSLEISCKYE